MTQRIAKLVWLATVVAGLAVVCASSPAVAQPNTPWPMFQNDWDHSGRGNLVGPLFPTGTPPASAVTSWTGPDRIKTSPAIAADGTIYVGVGFSLCAINPDMSEKWCERMGGDQSTSSPAIGWNGTIYIGNRGNKLVAFSPAGALLWEYHNGFEGDIFVSPTVGPDGTIYFALGQSLDGFGVVTALNPNGTLKWNFTIGNAVRDSSPAFRVVGGAKMIYIASTDGHLHAFEDLGGSTERRWRTKVGNGATASPVLAPNGTIYQAHNEGISAVNPTTGAIIWTFTPPTGGQMTQTPALGTDGTIYVGSKKVKEKILWALNPNGTEKWRYGPINVEVDKAPMPIVAWDDVIYVNIGPFVRALSPAGALLWNYQTSLSILSYSAIGGAPAAGGGWNAVLYVPSSDRKLRAIKGHRTSSGGGGGGGNTPPTAVAGPDQAGTPGQVFNFDGTDSFDPDAGDSITYHWTFGDGQSSTSPTPSHSYAAAGQYTVTLTVEDESGAQDTDTLVVNVSTTGGGSTFSDSFTRGDSSTLGNGWSEAQGDLVIMNNEMRNGPLAGNHMAVQAALAGVDQTVAADFASGNHNAAPRFGIFLRFQTTQSHYVCYRHISPAGKLRISKVVAGTETVLGQFGLPNPPQGTFFRLECSVVGSTIVLSLNGVPKVTVNDTTFSGSGKPGILIGTGTSTASVFRADNVEMTID